MKMMISINDKMTKLMNSYDLTKSEKNTIIVNM